MVITCWIVAATLSCGADVAAETIGRLFLSPEQRQALDRHRAASELPAEIEPVVVDAPEPVVPEKPEVLIEKPTLHVEGYVKRSHTSGTVWINGVNSYDGDMSPMYLDQQKVRILDDRVRLEALDSDTAVTLKPGEGYDPNRREVVDSYHLLPDTRQTDAEPRR